MPFNQPASNALYRDFALNLQAALLKKGEEWNAGLLASELNNACGVKGKYSRARIYNWLQGRHLPEKTTDAILLAQVLGADLGELLGVTKPVDETEVRQSGTEVASYENSGIKNIIEDDEAYTTERQNTILNTQRSLWIQLRVAPPLIDSLHHLKKLVNRKVKIKLLLSDLNDPCTMSMILRRNFDWAPDEVNALRNMNSALTTLFHGTQSRRSHNDFLKIRVIPYFPSTGMYISDPYTERGKLFAFSTFIDTDPYQAAVVLVNRMTQRREFDAYSRQFWLMWRRGDNLNMDEYFKDRKRVSIALPENFSRDR